MIKLVNLDNENAFIKLGLKIKDNFNDLYKLKDLLEKDYNYIFGYYINNDLVAFLHISKSFDVIDIVNIVVDDKYLRQGIATDLLNYVFKYFKDVNTYLLEVKVTNTKAINLYKKNGFEIISTRKKYYDGIDAYVMERSLI